ncbi:hypothetical protein [Polaribacter dokdonensis]|uniref:DUF4890 domain-containing protein n=1 Tax=Polaribacter dokdonensis DSW-5 TaxID=1300348 RepID=A0A0M9CEX7_9FLAO|nr:hypothetical protein [Polaribacter dokdonensis]KOY51142.1 hypothetical protein I602_702 [Polaribacter dokdonensis DSW-5]SEE17742.1 hypothetical protein SAMN05444353_1076 [Polaribacter dokdonensis DSW-5]
MKKIASILVLVFVFTFTSQAQQKRKNKRPNFSIEQRTELAVKKMTLALDLSEKQQDEIKPLLMAQAEDRKTAMEKRKALRDEEKKPTADELFAMKNQQLEAKIEFKNKMKDILKAEQFEKFEKMAKNRKQKGKKMLKGKAMKKRMENRRDR